MITEIVRYKIDSARSGNFQHAYEDAGKLLQLSPHCLGYEILHGDEEPENWIIILRWKSAEAHLKGFRTSPDFPKFLALVKPFYTDIQEMKHYSAVGAWTS